MNLKAILSDAERAAVVRALKAAGGKPQAAADILGIGKSSIYRAMQRHGIACGDGVAHVDVDMSPAVESAKLLSVRVCDRICLSMDAQKARYEIVARLSFNAEPSARDIEAWFRAKDPGRVNLCNYMADGTKALVWYHETEALR